MWAVTDKTLNSSLNVWADTDKTLNSSLNVCADTVKLTHTCSIRSEDVHLGEKSWFKKIKGDYSREIIVCAGLD